MSYDDFHAEQDFHNAWNAVSIEREVEYSLFTFGDSDLPYFLITSEEEDGKTASVTQGNIKISRPRIITPGSDHPEFENFFESEEDSGLVDFLLSRSAAFSNLRLKNENRKSEMVSDSVEEVVARLNRRLDDEEEDRTAILTAPFGLGGVALLRYTAERVWTSAPDNIQELRERGFLP